MSIDKQQAKEVIILASIKKLRSEIDELNAILAGKSLIKGEKGDKPVAGVDYPIPKDGYTPRKGIDYFDGKDGKTPKKGVDYFDGKDADPTSVAIEASKLAQDALKPLIPTINTIEQSLPTLGPEIRDSLELLQGEERLDKSAIKGIEELEKKIDKGKTNVIGGRNGMYLYIDGVKKGLVQNIDFKSGAGMSLSYSKINGLDTLTFTSTGGSPVKAYDISSQLNGVLKTFTIPSNSYVIDVRIGTIPPLRPTVDYTYTASSVTFTDEIPAETYLQAGQSAIIIYAE